MSLAAAVHRLLLDKPKAPQSMVTHPGPVIMTAATDVGRRMVTEGVVINGVEYDLVPRKAKG